MSKEALLEKIESLPAQKQAEVEDFVDFLAEKSKPSRAKGQPVGASQDEFLREIDERRERLRREFGLFDSVSAIRELREDSV